MTKSKVINKKLFKIKNHLISKPKSNIIEKHLLLKKIS